MAHPVRRRVIRKRGDPTLGRRKPSTPIIGRPVRRKLPTQGKAGPGDDLFPKQLPGRKIPPSQPAVKTPTKRRLRLGQAVGKVPAQGRRKTTTPTLTGRGRRKPPTSPGPNLRKKVTPSGLVIRKGGPTAKTTNVARDTRRRTESAEDSRRRKAIGGKPGFDRAFIKRHGHSRTATIGPHSHNPPLKKPTKKLTATQRSRRRT